MELEELTNKITWLQSQAKFNSWFFILLIIANTIVFYIFIIFY